jgi:LytS/YehU family sensor histidine kinase
MPEKTEGYLIAPLLLLPLVENCFKHGASQMLEHPWVALTIALEGGEMKMKLVNGKTETFRSTASGIGISNVRTRLDLLYPGRHQFRVTQTEDTFVVHLKLLLDMVSIKKAPTESAVLYE